MAEGAPIIEPFQILARFAEKFQLHLFKFTGAECKIARSNFISEGFANLSYSERQLFTSGALNILKIDKYALSGFWAEING